MRLRDWWERGVGRLVSLGNARSQPIPSPLWDVLLAEHPFLTWRSPSELEQLRRLCGVFLRHKEFHGADGFVVTDAVALAVAAQACLPVLHLGLEWYEGFVGIVMHAGPVLAQREFVDDLGLVHTYEEELVGEVHDGGPVMLSWHEGAAPSHATDATAFNVVIHEFAHVLDLQDGVMDGMPPMPTAMRALWKSVVPAAFDRFDERRACGYPSVVDAYGAQDIGEFFAVTAEAFFTRPVELLAENPELYALYGGFFRQDPASHHR